MKYLFFLLVSCSLLAADKQNPEDQFYQIITLPTPDKVTMEAGALQFLPDGKLALSTRLGDIFIAENVLDNPPNNVKYKLFASGLHEVLGLTTRDGWIYATQRGEVTRLKDTNNDGRADLIETVSDGWGITGDYHEYAFGSKFDRDGNIWVVLCLTGSFTSETAYRGWCLRVSPDGKVTPTVSGLRSPGGVGTNALGDMFYTENQGPWNGACALKHLKPGGFVGHPDGNEWYSQSPVMGPKPAMPESGSRMHIQAKRIPELVPPPVIFPYNKMGQSASGIAVDSTGGKFGPFGGQLFVGDQTHSTVMRVYLEQVNGRYQGVCFPFKSGFGSGSLGLEFAKDGSLFVYGTDRGWGARGGKPFALERLVWSGKVPFEIQKMSAKKNGFELTFTQKVNPETATSPSSYQLQTFTYIYQASYGSPEVDLTKPTITKITLAPDGLTALLEIDGLQEGHVHELHAKGVRSTTGEALLHSAAWYTLNYIPN